MTFSKDSRLLYGIRREQDRVRLFSLDIETKAVKNIGDLAKDFLPSSYLTPGIRLSLSPDARASCIRRCEPAEACGCWKASSSGPFDQDARPEMGFMTLYWSHGAPVMRTYNPECVNPGVGLQRVRKWAFRREQTTCPSEASPNGLRARVGPLLRFGRPRKLRLSNAISRVDTRPVLVERRRDVDQSAQRCLETVAAPDDGVSTSVPSATDSTF
jgi:hypothetical protein